MRLPSRPEDHPRPAPPRRAIDLSAALGPHPRRNLPELERCAPPPWDRLPPQWLEIEDSLPADHLARVIDEAVDQLDLTASFASDAGVGSKAHRPDLILKIVLSEIQTGRHSPDQWSQDLHDRRCLQWLGFGITPSRTRCSASRDRVGPWLDTLKRQVLGSAPGAGLTTARRGPLDGTRIAANASRHRSINLSRLGRRLAELDRVSAADKTGQDPGAIPARMARSPATRREQRYRSRAAQKKLLKRHARDARRGRDKRQEPEEIVLSPGDLEAALGRDKEEVFRPLDHLQVVRDLESPLILGYEVFAQATDAGTMMPLRQRVRDLSGAWIERLSADAGSTSASDLFDRAEAGVDLYAPSQENDQTEQRRAKRPGRQIPEGEFVRLPEGQTDVCPKGHPLSLIGQEPRGRAAGRSVVLTTYRCPKEPCQACPLAARCTRGANGRTIKRDEHGDLIVAQRAKMATPEAKAIYRQRSQTVELRFADAETHRGLRRFSGRGLTRVRIEVGLWVLSHNLLVVEAAKQRRAAEGRNGTPCQDAA